MSWFNSLDAKVKINEPLRRYTSFKIGGPAEYLIEPETESGLKDLLVLAARRNLRVLIVGKGSNLLVDDKGVRAIVVRLNSDNFKKLIFCGTNISAGAGCLINCLIQAARAHSLSGLEFMSGIPGTLGGALAMNAGIPGKNITDLVEQVTVMDYNGKKKNLRKNNIIAGYRSSSLSKYIILNATLSLNRDKEDKIDARINKYLLERKAKQETTLPSAGCVFKNPCDVGAGPDASRCYDRDKTIGAGRLIDLCGLKGKAVGGASVSGKHANFIVNTGRAKSEDVLELMGLIKKEVRRRFKISLQPEIKIWR